MSRGVVAVLGLGLLLVACSENRGVGSSSAGAGGAPSAGGQVSSGGAVEAGGSVGAGGAPLGGSGGEVTGGADGGPPPSIDAGDAAAPDAQADASQARPPYQAGQPNGCGDGGSQCDVVWGTEIAASSPKDVAGGPLTGRHAMRVSIATFGGGDPAPCARAAMLWLLGDGQTPANDPEVLAFLACLGDPAATTIWVELFAEVGEATRSWHSLSYTNAPPTNRGATVTAMRRAMVTVDSGSTLQVTGTVELIGQLP